MKWFDSTNLILFDIYNDLLLNPNKYKNFEGFLHLTSKNASLYTKYI